MKYAIATALTALVALERGVAAETHKVTIGPGLSYSPDSLTAAEGDVVEFTFGSGHDVVSGSFDSPCQDDGKIYSGFGTDGQVFSLTINSTDPIWLYCSVPHHCQGGMALSINAPSGKTIDDYKSAAAKTDSSTAPDSVVGGVLGTSGQSSSSASSGSSTTSATSSSSAAASSSSGSSATSSANSSGSTATATASSSGSSTSAATSATAAATSSGVAGNVVTNLGLIGGVVFGGIAILA